jgi:acetoacetyl-CoA synthetase
VVDDISRMPGAKWFCGARLNFVENLLRHRDSNCPELYRRERHQSIHITYSQFTTAWRVFQNPFAIMGIAPGDRVAGFMPNLIETR